MPGYLGKGSYSYSLVVFSEKYPLKIYLKKNGYSNITYTSL